MARGHFNHVGRIGKVGGSLPKNQTNLTKLFQTLKGGSGSGNFGHKGRKGIRGGSASGSSGEVSHNFNGINVVGKPSLGNFLTLWKWEKTRAETHGVPVSLSPKELPPLKEGYTRITHGTQPRNLESITRTGLKTGKEAGLGEEIDTILGVKGDKSGFGQVNIVFDLPDSEKGQTWRLINDEWVEINRTIKPSEMKGVVVTRLPVNPAELGEGIGDYKKQYGEVEEY